MSRMSAKKQNSPIEAVRNAATGYATIVLSVVCFLLVLILVMAGVRIVVGAGLGSTANTAQTAAIATANANETA